MPSNKKERDREKAARREEREKELLSKFDPYDHFNIVKEPDGTIRRLFDVPSVDPSPNPTAEEPAASKDVIVDPVTQTTARIFRPLNIPSNDETVARLPILFHFHSGGWILYSATTAVNTMGCGITASALTSLVVSVNYRLAPDHRLPAQYDDGIAAILWVQKQATDPDGEPWLKEYADFNRCYIFGSSNGGNIAFHTALRCLDHDLSPMKIDGIILYQPTLGGVKRTKSEIRQMADPLMPLPAQDLVWELTLPEGVSRDHRFCNPMVEGPHRDKLGSLGRCLVIGYGGDSYVDRQQDLVNMLVTSGVRVEARFDDVGFHGIEVIDPRRAAALVNMMREFIG